MNCVSIAHINYEEFKNISKEIECFELRLDLLNFNDQQLKQLLQSKAQSIVTYRTQSNDIFTLQQLKKCIDYGANYIDIDIEMSPDYIFEIQNYIKGKSTQLLISAHQKEDTKNQWLNLLKALNKAQSYQADMLKVAFFMNKKEDFLFFNYLYKKFPNIIAIGMGKYGKMSRLLALKMGAKWVYSSLSKKQETAKGQWDYTMFKRISELL